MANQTNSPWTDELRSEVKEMWLTHSAQQIASALQQRGYRFTRSSIIGLIHRAGLTADENGGARARRRSVRKSDRKPERKVRPVLRPVLRLVGASRNGAPMFKTVFIPELDLACADVEPRNVALMDLERDVCRYPYGDGPFTFCGHPTDGGSYCAGHKALCYAAPIARKAAA